MIDPARIFFTNRLCTSCNRVKEIVYPYENGANYCTECDKIIQSLKLTTIHIDVSNNDSSSTSMSTPKEFICEGCDKPLNIESDYLHKFKVCSECVKKFCPSLNEKKITKPSYVGAPAIFALELECRILNEAFDSFGCYLVGSSLQKQDWRDVDVRMIMKDEEFFKLFPDAGSDGRWEFDPRWLYMTISISERLSKQTGLPIDFQFQPQTHANKWHGGERHALGMHISNNRDKN